MQVITFLLAFGLASLAFALPATVSQMQTTSIAIGQSIIETPALGNVEKYFSTISLSAESFGCHIRMIEISDSHLIQIGLFLTLSESSSLCTFTTAYDHTDGLIASYLYDNACNLQQKRYDADLDVVHGQGSSGTFLDSDIKFTLHNDGRGLDWSFHGRWYKTTDCVTISGFIICRGQFECYAAPISQIAKRTLSTIITNPTTALKPITPSALSIQNSNNNTTSSLHARWIPSHIPLSYFCQRQPPTHSGWVTISSYFEKGLTNIYLFNWDCSILINQFTTVMPPGRTLLWEPYPRPNGNGCAISARVETDGNGISWSYRGRGYWVSGTPACYGYGAAVLCRGEFETATAKGVVC